MGEIIRIERDGERATAALMAAFGEAMQAVGGTFEAREATALAISNEVVRRWIADELQALAGKDGAEVVVAGERYRRASEGTVRYHTLCGPVAVRRASYRQVGVHNGPTVVPLELRAGLWENATPALALSVTQGFAARPLREYEVEMAAAHRVVPSRSTLERIGKRIGAQVEATLDQAAPEVRLAESRVDAVRSISVGLDRTTVPFAEPIPGAPIPAPRIRRRPAPVAVAYRMAYVGTVSLHDADGRVLETKRFGATPQDGPAAMLDRVAGEVLHQRARYPVGISVIQDGAPELWNLTASMCERHGISIADEVIDRFHVDERLANVCTVALKDPREAAALHAAWRHQLDNSDTAIDRIVAHLNQLVWHGNFGAGEGDDLPSYWRRRGARAPAGDALKTLVDHLTYFERHRRHMRYASRRRAGLPIGSGPTEGACKSLVTVRFKRSGQRWVQAGVAPCLSLRALHLSERLRPVLMRLAAARVATLLAA